MGTFSQKRLRVTIYTQKGTEVIEGFATAVDIQKTGGVEFCKASITIFGLSLDRMAALTWTVYAHGHMAYNGISVEASEGNGYYSVFKGEITFSAADLNGGRRALRIEAQTGALAKLIPDNPMSIEGTVKAADVIDSLAQKINYTFLNEGVTAELSNVNLTGDPITKIQSIARQVGATVLIEDGKIILTKKDEPRKLIGGIPAVSVESGLIGYPTLTNTGINCRCYFRPELGLGQLVRVDSIVPAASGVWMITQLTHSLTSEMQNGGKWESGFSGTWTADNG